jgi:hypothetical protein
MDDLYSLKQFVENQKLFTMGSLRDKIFKSKSNGLDESKAIVRIGRKIFIHKERFNKWLDETYIK